MKKKEGLGVVFTDHYQILIELEMPRSENVVEKPKMNWKTQ